MNNSHESNKAEHLPEIEITPHQLPMAKAGFESLGLGDAILRCIDNVGFKHPTPIQEAIIPTALSGKDVIGLAQTGSGKTAAFVLPLAERLIHGRGLRGLILCPTREIALQTKAFLDLFGRDHHLMTACLIGGVRMGGQIKDLQNQPDIIVATPGRLYDMVERGHIDLRQIQELVLDEADHMLDMGFLPQITKILKILPRKRHTMMFSATMPGAISRLAQTFLHEPVTVDIIPEGRAAQGITHKLYLVNHIDKDSCLLALLGRSKEVTLIFSRMKMDADWLGRYLTRNSIDVEILHSDRSQQERIKALESFRSGEKRVLIATDIASRGIDIPGIEHVINFDIPENVEDYIHRAGRTARGAAEGVVSTVATRQDMPRVKEIEAAIGKELPRCTIDGVEPYVEFKIKPGHDMRFRGGRRR